MKSEIYFYWFIYDIMLSIFLIINYAFYIMTYNRYNNELRKLKRVRNLKDNWYALQLKWINDKQLKKQSVRIVTLKIKINIKGYSPIRSYEFLRAHHHSFKYCVKI